MIFKEYFEDDNYKKIWHNYGFDRHIINNHGIELTGFGADTMHMARLADPSFGPQAYSLANVTKRYSEEIVQCKKDFMMELK